MFNVFLLSECNLHCEYCFADDIMGRSVEKRGQKDETTQIISLATYNQILDFLETSNIATVSLIGGEPTLHPNFFPILNRSLERGFTVSIKSNALWRENIQQGLRNLPVEGIHFLLNINHPSSLGTQRWKRVVKNAQGLKGRNLDFQLNISRRHFDYNYILELADKAQPQKIVWSLSHLVKGQGSETLAYPLKIRERYSTRLVSFLLEAGKRGIKTLGVHGITPCMFSKSDYQKIMAGGGNLESTCNPVFDFLPDLSVLFCFPMSGFWDKKYLYDFENLQALNMDFQEKLVFIRSDLYPLAECSTCDHARSETCHGGCLAQRIEKYSTSESTSYFDHVPFMTKRFQVEKRIPKEASTKATYFLLDSQIGSHHEIDKSLYLLLKSANGQETFHELYHKYFPQLAKKQALEPVFKDMIGQLIKRGVLSLMPSPITTSS